MKYVILIGDGMADYPVPERENKTALQLAHTPNLDFIAREGSIGLVQTIPDGMTAGSDIATLSILGYDPATYHTGRGPIEAMALQIPLADDEFAFRCNLITETDGILADFSGGHVTTEEARALIAALNAALRTSWLDQGWELSFHAGVSYRNILVLKARSGATGFARDKEIGGAPPHDIVGVRITDHLPKAALLREIMLCSKDVLEQHDLNLQRAARGELKANMVWLWSGGQKPVMPAFDALYGVQGAVISGVGLIKGIARLVGLQVIDVQGATGYFDTNYRGKAEYALRSLADTEFVLVHVEAPDEAGHLGDIDLKVQTIETFDTLVVGTVLNGLEKEFAATGEGYRILVMPDHYTPVSVGTHTREPVPFALYDSRAKAVAGSDGTFDEQSALQRAENVLDAASQELMRLLFQKR
ncbi:MAG: cofactor-independent phosphoglycerate mutase [Methanomicrobia archaeon]|nr:cofactor-independent phosphoglycerate mutase [Methanomicrobia archaeon]